MLLRVIPIILAGLGTLASFFHFSRFTVDDAFITWRYGKNLVEHGIWNYNPSMLDPTQAYTNPIYALLSIIPHLFGWDVVLFFKIFSILLLVTFVFWFARATRGAWFMTLLLVALPATMVHAFGGLETFLFVFLMGALFVSLYEHRLWSSVALTLLLFLTRPESWLLAGLVPAYFALVAPATHPGYPVRPERSTLTPGFFPAPGIKALLALGLPLAAYFAFHYLHFGSALPNTFYAKSDDNFHQGRILFYAVFFLPAILLAWFRKPWLAALVIALMGAMTLSYADSNLYMNYSGRFPYHLFAPVYILLVYLASRCAGDIVVPRQDGIARDVHIKWSSAITLMPLAMIGVFALSVGDSRHAITYYPRCLEAHGALGKTLASVAEKYGLRSLAIGEAGMASYHYGNDVFDMQGLGSSALVRKGLTPALLDSYRIDVIAFYARPEGITNASFNQPVLDWATANGFQQSCDVYWSKEWRLRLYTRQPIPELLDMCEASRQKNSLTDREMRKIRHAPPWRFWTE